jgi:RNA polymerase sigma-70 factor (ECF subfamily)
MTAEQERELTLLMAASQNGNRLAYEALLQILSRVVSLYVRRRVGDVHWLEDVVQEVLISIHRTRHTWNPKRPFAPWFYAVVKNRMIDAIRRRKRIGEREEPIEHAAALGTPGTDADTSAALDLAQAWERLSPSQRLVIENLKLHGKSVRDVARETGMSESNVKVTAHRGYVVLRRFLTSVGHGK